jgi:uncharacterized protein YcbK (DUF882 family)
MQITKNLNTSELRCKCGKCEMKINKVAVNKLQTLRDLCGFPLIINSAYRCERHNDDIGGAKDSMHMKGIAFDIGWLSMTQEQRHTLLRRSTELFKGIGLAKSFLHVDDRPNPCVWFY